MMEIQSMSMIVSGSKTAYFFFLTFEVEWYAARIGWQWKQQFENIDFIKQHL